MSDHSLEIQEEPTSYHPGPIDIVYGAESPPVKLADVARHIAAAKERGGRPIRSLRFSGCRFRDDGDDAPNKAFFRALGRKLRRLEKNNGGGIGIESLAIDGVVPEAGNDELISLAPFLNANSTGLRSLELTRASFDTAAIEGIRPFLSRRRRRRSSSSSSSSSLEVLILGECPRLGDDGAEAIASALQSSADRRPGRLRTLGANACGIGRAGARSISSLLRSPAGASLRVLDLSDNDVGDEGAEALAVALVGRRSRRRHHRLASLGLDNAGVGDRGALSLAKLLETTGSLRALSLENNARITNVGAKGLLKSIYDATSIRAIVESNHAASLNLRGCDRVTPNLLALVARLGGMAMLGEKKGEGGVARAKVSEFAANSGHGVTLEDFDLRLTPRLVAFVGEAVGATGLFQTLRTAPHLYTQVYPEDVRSCPDEDEEEDLTHRSHADDEEERYNAPTGPPCRQPDSFHLASPLRDRLRRRLAGLRDGTHHDRHPSQSISYLSDHLFHPRSTGTPRSVSLTGQQSRANYAQRWHPSFLETQGVFCLLFCLALKRRSRRVRDERDALVSASGGQPNRLSKHLALCYQNAIAQLISLEDE